MIPILSFQSIRSVEQAAMAAGLTEAELMDRAARGCVARICALEKDGRLSSASSYHVVAGPGNNGGDGLLIALYLHEAGRTVRVTRAVHGTTTSPGHKAAMERLAHINLPIDQIIDSSDAIQFSDNEILIDCLLGTGVTRPVTGLMASLVEAINGSKCEVIAVDLPTGTIDPCFSSGQGPIVNADLTITFEVPKPAFFFPVTGRRTGDREVVSIGLDPWYAAGEPRFASLIEPLDIKSLLEPRERFSHKGDHGHALLMAGGPGCHGAALLAARGCARSGVGLITVHGTEDTLMPIRTVLPDLMTSRDPSPDHIAQLPDLERYTSILFGPGIGRSTMTASVLSKLLDTWPGMLVIDADGLNLLAAGTGLIDRLSTRTVLTPHPREMDRLLGLPSTSGYDRLQRTREFARDNDCHIILKDAYTAVCSPDGAAYYLPTGNPGMAKGGTGDVLAGIVAGVAAQGYDPLNSSLISTYLHGRSGDLAAECIGMDAMRASDLVDHLSDAWKELRGPA